MRFAVRFAALWFTTVAAVLLGASAARTADFILADWENNGTGSGGPGTDFDTAPIDGAPSCTGCWLKGSNGVMSTLTQSTVGVTHGTKSLQVAMIGRGLGGGDGLQDTHFDIGARVIWSSASSAQYPGGDPRYLALRDAINGNQGLFTVEIDLTYDIPALRALHWLGPPVDYPAKPVQFIGMGLYKTNNNDGGPFVHVLEQVLPTLINPFDTQFDNITHLTRHVSIPLSQFQFTANPTTPPTFYEMGFSMNGNWGTNPASSNTEAASFYVDNLVLKQFNPVAPIDYNDNGLADTADWTLFMAQLLKTNPPAPPNANTSYDLRGNFGVSGTNGKVDFYDLVEFQRLYAIANPGAAALSLSVPEPSAGLMLGTLALVGLMAAPRRQPNDNCR